VEIPEENYEDIMEDINDAFSDITSEKVKTILKDEKTKIEKALKEEDSEKRQEALAEIIKKATATKTEEKPSLWKRFTDMNMPKKVAAVAGVGAIGLGIAAAVTKNGVMKRLFRSEAKYSTKQKIAMGLGGAAAAAGLGYAYHRFKNKKAPIGKSSNTSVSSESSEETKKKASKSKKGSKASSKKSTKSTKKGKEASKSSKTLYYVLGGILCFVVVMCVAAYFLVA